MLIREDLREYTRELMREAHEKGSPIIRPLFYTFPSDSQCWEVENQYMYGHKYLVCPVLAAGLRKTTAYLPRGATWSLYGEEEKFEGGQEIEVDCPLNTMPVFVRQE